MDLECGRTDPTSPVVDTVLSGRTDSDGGTGWDDWDTRCLCDGSGKDPESQVVYSSESDDLGVPEDTGLSSGLLRHLTEDDVGSLCTFRSAEDYLIPVRRVLEWIFFRNVGGPVSRYCRDATFVGKGLGRGDRKSLHGRLSLCR